MTSAKTSATKWYQIAVAPLAGLAFAVFLPAIGIIMAIYLGFRALAPEFGLRYDPLYSYFTGKRK